MLNTQVTCNVILFGRIGHGKTYLLNKVCGTTYPSAGCATSVTKHVQHGTSKKNGLVVIDTAGIGSSTEVAAHVAAQKVAVEDFPISGVYVIVKYDHRVDCVVRDIEPVMEFLESDDVRIIVTHVDNAPDDSALDEYMRLLSDKLEVNKNHMKMVGKTSNGEEIDDFIHSTLHEQKKFVIMESQIASIVSLASVRKYNKPIKCVLSKIDVASQASQKLIQRGKSHASDILVIATQNATTEMVKILKKKIFREAFDEAPLSMDKQNLVYGKAGLSLSLKLQDFIKSTNALLTWDISNPEDPRNHYRKCPNCDAVYVKVEGCDDIGKCGGAENVPARDESIDVTYAHIQVKFIEKDDKYSVQYSLRKIKYDAESIVTHLETMLQKVRFERASNEEINKKMKAAYVKGTRQLNIFCHKKIHWNTMIPLTNEELETLGHVERMRESTLENISRGWFKKLVRQHENENKLMLHPSPQ